MQDHPFEQRLRRRDVLRLIAAGTGVSVLMVGGSAPALAVTSRVAQAGATNQLNIAWNAAPPNLNPLNAVSQAQWTTFASTYSTLCMSDPDVRPRPGGIVGHRARRKQLHVPLAQQRQVARRRAADRG